MSKAEIDSGICGFSTMVEAIMKGGICELTISSDCTAIQNLAQELTDLNPIQEILSRRTMPQTLQMGLKHCSHVACPVPVGIMKAVEVEAKLALPADVSIRLFRSPKQEPVEA